MSRKLTLALFILLSAVRTLGGERFIKTIDQIKESVVPVVCGQFGAKRQFSIVSVEGTAFFVSPDGHFLTPAHVIIGMAPNPKRPAGCVPAIYIPVVGWERDVPTFDIKWMVIKECVKDDSLDLAVCTTVDKLPKRIATVRFTLRRPADGTPCAFTGFPLGVMQPLTSRGYLAGYMEVNDNRGPSVIVVDKGSWPGSSGSPIYNQKGEILGIVQKRGSQEGTGTTFGRTTAFITEFLSKNKIPFSAKK